MAKTPSTIITCNADALSRAADAILARGEKPSKNAILNALAAAIAGPGHDWGFVKNAREGLLAQPGVSPRQTSAPAPVQGAVWAVIYDEREDWSRGLRLFATREDALAAVAADYSWWKHGDHPFSRVMAVLATSDSYTFAPDDDADDEAHDAAEPYRIAIERVEIETPAPEAGTGPKDQPQPSEALVLMEPPVQDREQGLAWELIFKDQADLDDYLAKHDLDPGDLGPVHRAKDCTLTATFRPEAWQNDYAIPVDPEGETSWTVDADELEPDQSDLDYLSQSRRAPAWVKDWGGPYEVDLEIKAPKDQS